MQEVQLRMGILSRMAIGVILLLRRSSARQESKRQCF